MNILKSDFLCVPPGEIYPVTLSAGEACPDELVPAAILLGHLPDPAETPPGKKVAQKAAAEPAAGDSN